MMKYKKGFTLIELIIAIGMFSMVSIVIGSLFMSNYIRIEAQGRETYLQEDIDRGLTRLSDRLMGTCKIIAIDQGSNTESMTFEYYYKDNTIPYVGELYLVEKDGVYNLKLDSIKEGEENTNTLMSYLEGFRIKFIDEDGLPVSHIDIDHVNKKACTLEISYSVTTSYKKIVKKKNGTLNIKLRNIRSRQ